MTTVINFTPKLLAVYWLFFWVIAIIHNVDIGKILIILGAVLIVFGGLLAMGFRGFPGDIVAQKKNAVFIFPIVTSLVLSLLISLMLLILRK